MPLTENKIALSRLGCVVGCIIFGFSFLFTRVALNHASPYLLLSCRFALACLVMTIPVLLGKVKIPLRGKPWKLLLLLGVFQPVLYFFGESYGVLYTSATFSAVMIALIPIVTMWLSALLLRERVSLPQVFFCLLSVAGVVLITAKNSGGANQVRGILFLLLAVVSDGFFYLISRKLSTTFSAYARTYLIFLEGFAVFVLCALRETHGSLAPFRQALATPEFLWAVLYLGLLSSVLAFLLINYAGTYLPAAQSAAFANITTIVSVFAGVFFLHEAFSALSLAASGMIVLGVWGVQKPSRSAVPSILTGEEPPS